MRIRYTPEAIRDLQEMRRYISKTLHNPKAADRIAKAILDTCSALKQQPQMGASLEAKIGQSTDLRYLICEKRIAFYRVEDEVISIARIIDGRQDYLHILFGEEYK